MPLEKLPDCGLTTFYADESDDKKTYVISTIAIPTLGATKADCPIEWDSYLTKSQEWKADLRDKFGIPVRKELKGSKLATGRNSYQPRGKRLHGPKALEAYAHALRGLDFLPSESVFSVTCERSSSLYGYTKLEAALYATFQRMQRKCESDKLAALIFFDEGHGEYRQLFRKAKKYLPTGSKQGNWGDGSTSRSMPLINMLEDANFKDSKQSIFVQIADLVAYATLQKIRKEQGRQSEREKELWFGSLHDQIPKRILNTRVDTQGTDGIKRLK
ncbi:MAG: DUF3800 domain-containing protein [Pseudomonadota bacterium]